MSEWARQATTPWTLAEKAGITASVLTTSPDTLFMESISVLKIQV